jgi:hypothetical protein
MAKNTKVTANFSRATVAKAWKRLRRRIEVVVEAGGDFSDRLILHVQVYITRKCGVNTYIGNQLIFSIFAEK